MQIIKQSEATAAYRRVYFLAVDPTDLKTRKTGLGFFAVEISKNGGGGAAGGGAVTQVDATNLPGVYYYECAATDVDTLGQLALVITQASMETREIVVAIAKNNLQDNYAVNVTAWNGTAPDNLSSGKLPADVKLWLTAAPAALTTSGYVQTMLLRWLTDNAAGTPGALQSGRVDGHLGAVAAGVLVAASFAANALGAVWDELVASHTTVGTIGKLVGDDLDAKVSTRAQPSDVPSAATSAAAVWNEATAGHVTAGTYGKLVNDDLDARVSSRAAPTDVPSAATVGGAVWDVATSGHTTAGTFGANVDAKTSTRAQPSDIPSAATVASQVLGTAVPGAFGAGTAGKLLGNLDAAISSLPSAASIATQVISTAVEGAKSVGDVLRGSFRLLTSKKRGYDTGTVVVRDAADTKDSITITADATGVTAVTYNDLT